MTQIEIFPGEVFAKTADFDPNMPILIPVYTQMLDTLVSCLPPASKQILELGCGTGALSLKLLESSPALTVTACDYSPRMLSLATAKAAEAGYSQRFTALEMDFGAWACASDPLHLQKGFDACLSSLAIHHLPNELKLALFKKIRAYLKPGGVFWNADPVLETLPWLGEVYEQIRENWAKTQGASLAAIREKMGKSNPYGYSSQDQLATLEANLEMLKQAGFEQVTVVWKYYNLAIAGGLASD